MAQFFDENDFNPDHFETEAVSAEVTIEQPADGGVGQQYMMLPSLRPPFTKIPIESSVPLFTHVTTFFQDRLDITADIIRFEEQIIPVKTNIHIDVESRHIEALTDVVSRIDESASVHVFVPGETGFLSVMETNIRPGGESKKINELMLIYNAVEEIDSY